MKFLVSLIDADGRETTFEAAKRKHAKQLLKQGYEKGVLSNKKIFDSSIGLSAYRIVGEMGNAYGVIQKI